MAENALHYEAVSRMTSAQVRLLRTAIMEGGVGVRLFTAFESAAQLSLPSASAWIRSRRTWRTRRARALPGRSLPAQDGDLPRSAQ